MKLLIVILAALLAACAIPGSYPAPDPAISRILNDPALKMPPNAR